MIQDLATFLAEHTNLVAEKTLFKANMPESAVDAVCIFDTGGQTPDQYLPITKPTVQVMCRGRQNNYKATMARAREIFNLLNQRENITIGDAYIMRCQAMASPQSLGLDDKQRWQIVTNFLFQVRT